MKAPVGHWGTQTFIAALRHDGLTVRWVIDSPMNRRIFEAYVETQLALTLKPGDRVIRDNLSSHKSENAAATLKERRAGFLFLPLYSPDLNPIEMAFAKLKAHLRKAKARKVGTANFRISLAEGQEVTVVQRLRGRNFFEFGHFMH